MIYLPEEKQPKPYYTNHNQYVGLINIKDGLVDITDPCYENDTWCAMFNKKVKAGKYKCYACVVNFSAKYEFEATDMKVLLGKKKVGQTTVLTDRRLVELVIKHETISGDIPSSSWEKIGRVGVDAGLCGFYNHKPDFTEDEKWMKFCSNLKSFPYVHNITCDIKPYGITVSSGFGDGYYDVFAYKVGEDIVALKLIF